MLSVRLNAVIFNLVHINFCCDISNTLIVQSPIMNVLLECISTSYVSYRDDTKIKMLLLWSYGYNL